jgi:hypothetical protein
MPNVKTFCEALKANTSLTEISLLNTGLESAGCVLLQHAIAQQGRIRKLHLIDNNVGAGGAAMLIRQSTVLEEVFLWRCSIDNVGVRALADALCHNSTLKTLDLRWNRLITNACLDDIRRSLTLNSTLQSLRVDICGIGSQQIEVDQMCARNRRRHIQRTIFDVCLAFASLDLPTYVSAIMRLSLERNICAGDSGTDRSLAVANRLQSREKSRVDYQNQTIDRSGSGCCTRARVIFIRRLVCARGSSIGSNRPANRARRTRIRRVAKRARCCC